jgi:hypothetical protein
MKKYRSLTDIYTSNVIFKDILRENEYFMRDVQGKETKLGSSDDPDMMNAYIGSLMKGGLREHIAQLIKLGGWLDFENIDTNKILGDNYIRSVADIFILTYSKDGPANLDLEKFAEHVQRKERGQLDWADDYIRQGKMFPLKKKLADEVAKFILGPRKVATKQAIAITDRLWNELDMPIGTVGVGPGEMCMSFFTNAKKGDKGDLAWFNPETKDQDPEDGYLKMPIGDVELKSSHGRPGASNNVHTQYGTISTIKNAWKASSATGSMKHEEKFRDLKRRAYIAQHEINNRLEFLSRLFNDGNHAVDDLNDATSETVLPSPVPGENTDENKILAGGPWRELNQAAEYILDSSAEVIKRDTVERTVMAMSQHAYNIMDAMGWKFQNEYAKMIANFKNAKLELTTSYDTYGLIQWISELGIVKLDLGTVKSHEPEDEIFITSKGRDGKEKEASWGVYVQRFFFHDWGIPDDKLIEVFVSMSTESVTGDNYESFATGIKRILKKGKILKLIQSDQLDWSEKRAILARVVGAIQITSYQALAHNFDYIMWCDAGKAASHGNRKPTGGAIAFGFPGDTIGERVFYVWQQLEKNQEIINDLNIDSRNKGVSIYFSGGTGLISKGQDENI